MGEPSMMEVEDSVGELPTLPLSPEQTIEKINAAESPDMLPPPHTRSRSLPDPHNSMAFRNKFRVVRQLGESRDGGVVEAVSLDDRNPAAPAGTRVAVKIFNLPSDPQEREVLKKWAKWEFMGLDGVGPHPNILQNYELIIGPNNLFLVTELCDCDLYFATDLSEPLPTACVVTIFGQMLDAAKRLHECGVCHGDIKLENFFVKLPPGLRHNAIADPNTVESFRVVLGDFGFWAQSRNTDGSDVLVYGSGGSDVYGPWEQTTRTFAQLGYNGHLSDIYSLGVCLFVLVAGFPPWETSMDLSDAYYQLWLYGHVKTYWTVMDKHTGFRLSDEFKDLVSKMMAVDPTARISLAEVEAHPFMNKGTVIFDPQDYVVPRALVDVLHAEFGNTATE